MVGYNEKNEGFSESLGENENSTKFTFVGRSQTKYLENPAFGFLGEEGGETGVIEAIEIAAMSVPGAVADLGSDVENKSLAGFDTIFSPYTTASGHPELPHFEIPTVLNAPNSYTLNPFNPNNIFTTGTSAAPRSQAENNAIFQASGHNIQFANTWTTGDITGATSGDVDFCKDLYDNSEFTYDNVRSIGLRSPIVLTGWGFDTAGDPVPADPADPTAFASGAFREPSGWKSGPLDVRWDDERKVWTGGSNTEIMKFTVTQPHISFLAGFTACDHVLATVNDVGCTTTSVVIGQTGVLVFDEDACFFNLPISILYGMKGTAEKFVNPYANLDPADDSHDCNKLGRNQGACRWVVTGLCCNEEIIVPVPP